MVWSLADCKGSGCMPTPERGALAGTRHPTAPQAPDGSHRTPFRYVNAWTAPRADGASAGLDPEKRHLIAHHMHLGRGASVLLLHPSLGRHVWTMLSLPMPSSVTTSPSCGNAYAPVQNRDGVILPFVS